MPYRIFALLILFAMPLFAEEGMWLFDAAPKEQVHKQYGFELTDEWLEHVQLSSVRFGRGGSASFVSSSGLVMTNHHVGARQLQELSTPERDLLTDGFYAKTHAEELPCKGLELNVLISTEDVTEKVNAAVTPGMSPEDAQKARQAAIADLEKASKETTGLKSEVMTFYQGGAYHLYRYKVYDDVRLVWAPESDIGSFGGDPDNYEFPRYCLDCSFFRAYENGKPAKIEHFLKWSKNGAKDGDLVFVSGHPGRTDRALTREHLEFQRDVYLPWRLQKLFRREVIYSAFAERSEENARRIRNDLDAVKNYRKRAIGQLQGLQTPSLFNTVTTTSPVIIAALNEMFWGNKWDSFSGYHQYDLFEVGEGFNCRTFQIARSLVRLAYESVKPNEKRLKEYRDGALESLKASLLADTPIYEDVEILKLTDSLTMLWETHKPQDRKESPKESAVKLIRGSKVRDVVERKRLIEGGIAAIEASDDPMIQYVLELEPSVRALRKVYEERFEAPLEKAYTELARKRFEEFGTNIYPDATFTLRLSYGTVKGYTNDDGTYVEPITNIAGMYKRAEEHKFTPPFAPPQSWKDGREKLDPATPFNLATTNDIIGGNSGSPLINTDGEVVGLVFDGNIYSLSNNFIYTDTQSRCVSVHSAVIVEALRKIYGADKLADELGR
ncbi:MAG: S46 family peptidase [Planctomycetaceae bacterium]|nr:S46 family peptidase [Planctomycetaceae bacterium]